MSKCSRCQNDFVPLLKSDGLPYKHCDRCRCTDKKYRETHEEQRKLYRDQYYLDNQDKINAKRSERITCECGCCTSRRDKISQHKKSSCHQKLMEEKKKIDT